MRNRQGGNRITAPGPTGHRITGLGAPGSFAAWSRSWSQVLAPLRRRLRPLLSQNHPAGGGGGGRGGVGRGGAGRGGGTSSFLRLNKIVSGMTPMGMNMMTDEENVNQNGGQTKRY